jgi:hypothetical protein
MLILEKSESVPFMRLLAQQATHFLALIARKLNFLIVVLAAVLLRTSGVVVFTLFQIR